MLDRINFNRSLVEAKNFSAKGFVAADGKKINVECPFNGQIIGQIQASTPKNIDEILKQAQIAQRQWEELGIKGRTQILFNFRQALKNHADEIAQQISLESGKTLAEAMAGLEKGIEVVEYATSIVNIDRGGKMEVSRGVFCEYRRRPLGVVASITPFNFPAMVPLWTIPIALVMGNSFIWKPSEKTPLTANLIAKCWQEAKGPLGVFNIVHGDGESATHLIQHPALEAISFVGSTAMAKKVYLKGSEMGKRVLALGGAKNHIVLLPDALEEICARGISDSFTGCAGQRCMAASALLAVGDVEKQISAIVAKAKSTVLGQDMGAIITKEQVEFLHQMIDQAQKAGAKILLDGRSFAPPRGFEKGFWIGPTIIDGVSPESEAAKRELFGPILSIIRAKNLSQAMDIENANPYGNACSVFTRDGASAEYVAQRAQSAMVGINVGVPVPREPFSFGGMGQSRFGHGDITGEAGIAFWSQHKKITSKWEAHFNNWMA